MSKAVLISIRPKWCTKIASGEKTIEIRKTKPNLDVPFKAYIYCTSVKNMPLEPYVELLLQTGGAVDGWSGKVIGEFICTNIYEIDPTHAIEAVISEESCVSPREIHEYLRGKTGYGWSISDLKIYDQPEGLSTFSTFRKCNSCKKSGYESTACIWDKNCIVPATITRPPQSWCYVEEM